MSVKRGVKTKTGRKSSEKVPSLNQAVDTSTETGPVLVPSAGTTPPAYDRVGSRETRTRRRTHRVKLRRLSGADEYGLTVPPAIVNACGAGLGDPMTIATDGQGTIVYRLLETDHIESKEPLEVIVLRKSDRLDVEGWLAHAAGEMNATALRDTNGKRRAVTYARARRCAALAKLIGGRR